eukprot:TRINITY_DN4435_c0_g1_i3.p1 TRINITY_DN4435_c0_g1~~TRINITY_DN4435_c0_g1_i3.p1  ORF type:complete len:136 (+),score=32.11 TRINITY_DN4435_c0_g1_i3:58-465(+)
MLNCMQSNRPKIRGIPQGTELEDVLANEEYEKELEQFLMQIFASENLEFYHSVVHFKENPNDKEAEDIVHRFINDDCESPITFESDFQRMKLLDQYNGMDGLDETIFDLILLEVRESLRTSLVMHLSRKFNPTYH